MPRRLVRNAAIQEQEVSHPKRVGRFPAPGEKLAK
jgi:hypothetical protein